MAGAGARGPGGGSKGPRIANHMTRDEYKAQAHLEGLSWQQFEKKIDGTLRANGWEWWSDRVIPPGVLIKAGVPRHALGAVLKIVNSYGRKEGLPDRLVRREFASKNHMSEKLWELVRPPAYDINVSGVLTAVGFIEIKTGGATTTAGQDKWIEAAALCPGMFSVAVWPQGFDLLVELLGGEKGSI